MEKYGSVCGPIHFVQRVSANISMYRFLRFRSYLTFLILVYYTHTVIFTFTWVIYINYTLIEKLLIAINTHFLWAYGNMNEPGGVCCGVSFNACTWWFTKQRGQGLAWTTFTRFSQIPLLGVANLSCRSAIPRAHLCIQGLSTGAGHSTCPRRRSRKQREHYRYPLSTLGWSNTRSTTKL